MVTEDTKWQKNLLLWIHHICRKWRLYLRKHLKENLGTITGSDEAQLTEYMKEISGGFHPLNYGLLVDGKLTAVSIGQIKHWWQGTEYYLDELFVDPDEQGQGTGSRFLQMIEEDVKKRGLGGIFLQTDNDKPAYGFYQRRHFKELTEHVSFFKQL